MTAGETLWDLIIGLKDIAVFSVTLVGDQIEFIYKLHKTAFQATGNVLTNDQQAAQEALIEMGLLFSERANTQQEFIDNVMSKAKEGYDMMMQLYDDSHSRTLLWDYFNSLYDSLSYREQQNVKSRIVLEVGIEVLLALATAGSANAIRRGAQAAIKTVNASKAANIVKRIGPFTLEAIEHMAELSRLLKKPPLKESNKLPIRVIPEGDKYDAAKQSDLIVGRKGGSLSERLDVAPDSNTLRQTGGGGYLVSADELYDAIRASNTDVGSIAKNTGIKTQNIQKVKDHVFYNEHLLDRYVDYGIPAKRARFDSDLNQAQAWQRLESGNHTDADINWLKHETAERWYELRHNSGYSEAHNAAERKWSGEPWGQN